MFSPWKKSYNKSRQCIKEQRHYFANKCPYSQSCVFSSSHVCMYELDDKVEHQRTDAFKLWCWRRLWRVPWTTRRSTQSPVNSKGNQSWIFIGRIDAEAETPILCPPDAKSWLIWKDCFWERLKAGGEGDNRGWDGWMASPLDGYEFEQALGVGDGQGGLVCCSPWGPKESDTTEQLNWIELRLQEAWGLCAHAHQVVNIFHLVKVFESTQKTCIRCYCLSPSERT